MRAVVPIFAACSALTAAPSMAASSATPSSASLERLGELDAWIVPARCPPSRRPRLLVVLHGYGARRERLGELVDSYAARHCGVLIFPLAPVDLSRDRLAWWRPRTRRPLRTWRPAEVVLPGVARAVQAVEGLLEEVRARFGVASNDVVVAGFSQGATLAAHVGMNAAAPLGAVVLLGGRFHTVERSGSCSAALAGTPVLIAHGDADRVAPFAGAQRLRRALEESGVDVEWVGFRGGHRPSPAVQRRFHGALAAELERPRHG